MKFAELIQQAWADLDNHPGSVAARLENYVSNVSHQEDIRDLVSLITHTYGERLGQWHQGVDQLEKLQLQSDSAEVRQSIFRGISALRLAGELADNVDDLMASDQIRVLCLACSALLQQGQEARALSYYNDALQIVNELNGDVDPAFKSLASASNKVAAYFERRKQRTPPQTDLMVRAARNCLKYWLHSGTWQQQQLAHFRLSKSLLAAGLGVEALEEAMSCLAVCKSNAAGPYELFWANEAVASVIHVSKPSAYVDYLKNMREYFENLPEADKPGCEPRLKELESSVA